MNRDLEDRIAVVLGGGSVGSGWGIGKAISVAYAKAGALVAVADKDLDRRQGNVALVEAEGGRAEAYAANILDDVELTAFLTGLLDRHGRVDILHCNVGLGKQARVPRPSPGDWRQICNANLTSVHVAVSAVAPAMREARRGVILTTSSIAGIRDVGYPHVAYGATKAAAIHLMRLLAIENAPYGLRANSIIAGLVDTPRIEKTLAKSYGGRTLEEMKSVRASQCPMGRMGTAFDIADAAVFLASDKASYITGTELLVDGGLAATVRQSDYKARLRLIVNFSTCPSASALAVDPYTMMTVPPANIARRVAAVYECLIADLKRSTKLFMDETPAPVLDPGHGRTKTGCLWAMVRSDRSWCRPAPPGVAYRYASGRGGIHAQTFLLEVQQVWVSAKSRLGEALHYLARHWQDLSIFLANGQVEIDTNAVECSIRPLALGHKNHLFADHDAGAENWAVLASLIETCKRNGIEPFAYLKATLERLVAGHKQAAIAESLPWNYAFAA